MDAAVEAAAAAKRAWKKIKRDSTASEAAQKAAKAEYKRAKAALDEARRDEAQTQAVEAIKAGKRPRTRSFDVFVPDEARREEAKAKAAKRGRPDPEGATADAAAEAKPAAKSTAPGALASFAETPFSPTLRAALTKAGFTEPTPIQAQAWPVLLAGDDLVAVAKTGSGKTLGFLLPAFHRLTEGAAGAGASASSGAGGGGARGGAGGGASVSSPRILVVAPTRELAQQIGVECDKFGGRLRTVCVYGGTAVAPMKAALRKIRPTVVVATPGRLVDLMEQRAVSLSEATYVVLDEADRMLDMGFEPQMKQIFDALPPQTARQTALFSATWPKSIRKMAATFLKPHTAEVFVGGGPDAELQANKAVSQRFIEATDDEKDRCLYNLMTEMPENHRVVIFANTKRRVDKLADLFWNEGFGTVAVHGGKPQRDRDAALRAFVAAEAPMMFATDVAARGLDIKGVTHVVNYDMARDVESYVHRIGRTGRAGELGASITFWNKDYDVACTPALVKIARDAQQEVPAWLAKHAGAKASKQWKVQNAVLR